MWGNSSNTKRPICTDFQVQDANKILSQEQGKSMSKFLSSSNSATWILYVQNQNNKNAKFNIWKWEEQENRGRENFIRKPEEIWTIIYMLLLEKSKGNIASATKLQQTKELPASRISPKNPYFPTVSSSNFEKKKKKKENL